MVHKPTVRIVIDTGMKPADYLPIFQQVHAVASVVGQLMDSTYMPSYTVAQTIQHTKDYFAALAPYTDYWEIGNEPNGDWCGPNAVAQVVAMFDTIVALGGKTMLTPYLDCPTCLSPNSQYAMIPWLTKNMPDRIKTGVDLVALSYYDDDNSSWQPDPKDPTYKSWDDVFGAVRKIFPSAMLGIGECGPQKQGPSTAAQIIARYYHDIVVTDPKFVWGGFYWYFDTAGTKGMIPSSNPNLALLNAAIK